MGTQYFWDGRRKQRGTYLSDDGDLESFANRNQKIHRYPGEEYPSDSYYIRHDAYRQ